MSVADDAGERALELHLTVPITPKGQGRPRFDPRSGRAYTDEKTRAYIGAVRAAAEIAWGAREPLSGPVWLSVRAIFSLPKAALRKGRAHHTQKPDGSNVLKAVEDALLPHWIKRKGVQEQIWAGVLADDAQIVDARVRKEWSIERAALVVQVWSLA